MEEDNKNVEETKEEVVEELAIVQDAPTEEQVVSETNNDVNQEEVAPVETPVEVPVESVPTETVEENNEETNNNGKQKKNIPPVLFVILLLLFFGIGVLLGKVLFGGESKDKKENTGNQTNTETTNTETTNTETNTEVENNNNENTNTIEDNTNNEKPVDNQNLVFDDNAKNKINEFMKVAMYSNDMGEGFPWKFVEGLNGLTKEQKEKLTYTATAKMDNMTELTQETVPAKYKNAELFNEMPLRKIYELPLQIYANKYKEFFNEEFVESGDYTIAGCPYVFKIDRELEKIYLSDQCGGTSGGEWDYLYLNYQYETDKDYYYVYQYNGEYMYNYNEDHIDFKRVKSDEVVFTMPRTVGERVDTNKLKEQFELNASKFEKIKWTFDKNLVFVSTENLG